MNQREKEILELELDFRDTLENEFINEQSKNKIVTIKDIKLVGEAVWKDKINNKNLSENVFLVEKEVKEIDSNGKERITVVKNYYFGIKCIVGLVGDEVIYKESFKNSEPDKMNSVNELLDKTSEQDIEQNSLYRLQEKELSEVKEAGLSKDAKKEDVDKIKVNGVQKVDLNKLVDGKESLRKRLDLEQYDSLYVVYSDKVDSITLGSKRPNTEYSLVGMTNDGDIKVLDDEFEIDKTVGNRGSREQTKIRANSTATQDNKDVSVYTRKSNGVSIGCENNHGNVDMFLYKKSLKENENVGIQIETSKTPVIPMETREIMNSNKGIYQQENVKKEIEKHIENDYEINNVKDFDGDEETMTHVHISENMLNNYVIEILNYENEVGEEKIKEVFTENEIKDKLLRELKENSDKISVEQIVESVKKEMNQDAEIFVREHKF